jgi:hypothetical protein
MVMKIDIRVLALSEALVGAALFVFCAAFIALAPDATANATKYLFHMDLSNIARPVSWGGFLSGLVVFTLFMGIVGLVWGWFYNRLARR